MLFTVTSRQTFATSRSSRSVFSAKMAPPLLNLPLYFFSSYLWTHCGGNWQPPFCVHSQGMGGKINKMNITKVKPGGGFSNWQLVHPPQPPPHPPVLGAVTEEAQSPRRTLRVSWWIASPDSLAFLADMRQDSPGMMEEAMTAGNRLEISPRLTSRLSLRSVSFSF